jgi:hypothetical protein
VLKTVYFVNVKSLKEYGIIFWANSPNATRGFLLQKEIVQLMVGVSSRCSFRKIFRNLDILTLPCLYIYSLMRFVLNHFDSCQVNLSVHGINTRSKNLLHMPNANLSSFQREVFYSGMIFNSLPLEVVECKSNLSCFKTVLWRFLVHGSFYSLEEFY